MAASKDADTLSLASCNKDEVKEKIQEYDYIRFTWANLNGSQMGMTYTAMAASRTMDLGMHAYTACMLFGPRSEIPVLPEINATKHGNCTLLPDPSTFHKVPWAGGKHRIAEVLCESYWLPDKIPQPACPRFACRKQFAKLQEAGYKLKLGFEVEFRLEDAKTAEPVFSGHDVFNHTLMGLNEEFLFDVVTHLSEININVEKIHTEDAPGQFEITLVPEEGIKAADDTFILKHTMKELAARRGMLANFMSKPEPGYSGSGMHLNHSVWTMDGRNAFYDESDESNLSKVARHWIAGLLVHSKALTALCGPSVNCYRRLHGLYVPHTISWGMEDRVSTFRVKNHDQESTYIENRLPGGVCNPYLVIAAHIAAGLDGLERQLECPPPSQIDAEELPHTLQDALDALAEDTILSEALGEELVAWFIQTKRQIDLTTLKDSDVKVNDLAAYRAEWEMYAKYV